MTRAAFIVLLATAAAAVGAGIVLFVWKVLRHRRAKKEDFRRAVYIAAIGELVTRGVMPTARLRQWRNDPAFRDTLIDYLRFVEGAERRRLVELTRHMEMIDGLHEQLTRSRRRGRRLAAAAQIAEIGDSSSRSSLVAALGDRCPEVRIQAAAGLARIGEASDVRAVLRVMEAQDTWAAQRLADALVEFGAAAVQALSNYVLIAGDAVEFHPKHLAAIVQVLGEIGDPQAEAALLAALDHPDALIRLRAAAALKAIATPRTTRALLRRMTDEDWRVRAKAATALAGHPAEDALAALSRALRDEAFWVRQNASESLAELPGGTDALFEVLAGDDQYAVDAALARLVESGAIEEAKSDLEKRQILERLDRPYLLDSA